MRPNERFNYPKKSKMSSLTKWHEWKYAYDTEYGGRDEMMLRYIFEFMQTSCSMESKQIKNKNRNHRIRGSGDMEGEKAKRKSVNKWSALEISCVKFNGIRL